MREENDRLHDDVKWWQAKCAAQADMIRGLNDLLVAYRLGTRAPEKAFKLLDKAKAALDKLAAEVPS